MPSVSADPAPAIQRLDDILLGLLLPVWPWPGGDGITTDDALAYYPRAAAFGQVPTHDQLRRLYPERVDEIQALFANRSNRPCLPTAR